MGGGVQSSTDTSYPTLALDRNFVDRAGERASWNQATDSDRSLVRVGHDSHEVASAVPQRPGNDKLQRYAEKYQREKFQLLADDPRERPHRCRYSRWSHHHGDAEPKVRVGSHSLNSSGSVVNHASPQPGGRCIGLDRPTLEHAVIVSSKFRARNLNRYVGKPLRRMRDRQPEHEASLALHQAVFSRARVRVLPLSIASAAPTAG